MEVSLLASSPGFLTPWDAQLKSIKMTVRSKERCVKGSEHVTSMYFNIQQKCTSCVLISMGVLTF